MAAADNYLVVKGTSGLGNRMLCALGGIMYARLSARKLIIDWSDPVCSSDGKNSFHRYFQSRWYCTADPIPSRDSVYPPLWRGRLHENLVAVARDHQFDPDKVRSDLSIDIGKLDYAEEVAVLAAYSSGLERLRPYFEGGGFQTLAAMPRPAILGKMLREDLILEPQIRARVEEFKRANFAAKTVGVHIRFTDYRVRIFSIIKRLNALLAREPRLQIFLATDNSEIERLFEKSYPSVLTTRHWFPTPGSAIHTNSARPDVTRITIEALVDMYLLADCDYLVFDGSSSFARVASLLRSASPDSQFNVKSRGKGDRRIRGMITRTMRRLRFSSWAFRLLPKIVSIRRL